MKSVAMGLIIFGGLWAGAAEVPLSFQGENLLNGKFISINTQGRSDKGLVVVFLSAKCPCSNSHVAELKKLSEDYKDFSFVAIHSNSDETKEAAQNYFQKLDFSFPVIEDQKTQIADALHAHKTPHSFVISSAGKILYQGGVTNSANAANADKHFLKDVLEDIKRERPVSISEGRTLGCAIVRADD